MRSQSRKTARHGAPKFLDFSVATNFSAFRTTPDQPHAVNPCGAVGLLGEAAVA